MAEDIEGLTVPEGWKIDPKGYGRNTAVIEGPGTIGYVTIDWEARGFRAGLTTMGPVLNKEGFSGRGWKQALVDAGVAWLKEVEEKFQCRQRRNHGR